jgi:transcriptional regulator with XRE-family HTH domain
LLKQARMERDLTQTGVATAIGRTPHHYTLIEIGQKLPSMKTFAKLQHCLGFDANELLDALLSVPRPFSAFGHLLGSARNGQGMMITEIASAVGCAADHYWRIEAGAELPTIMLFVRLHRVLGFDADSMLVAAERAVRPSSRYSSRSSRVTWVASVSAPRPSRNGYSALLAPWSALRLARAMVWRPPFRARLRVCSPAPISFWTRLSA